MKVFAVLALCLVAVSAGSIQQTKIIGGNASISPLGVMQWTRCGGVGTLREVRIEGCSGATCNVYPGNEVFMEGDLIPATAAPGLTLTVTAVLGGGFRVQIMKIDLVNSSVQPGQLYILKFSIVPNDLLSGQTVTIQADVHHTVTSGTGTHEICAGVSVRVN